MKTRIFIILVFLYGCNCSYRNITINGNLEKENNEQIIVDPIEPKILCGPEFGIETSNITIFNPNLKNVLKGQASIIITFNNIDSLKIVNAEISWLRLKDSATNKIILNCGKFEKCNRFKKNEIAFYEGELIPIIKNYKCWTGIDNKENFSKRISYNLPFTVYPELVNIIK